MVSGFSLVEIFIDSLDSAIEMVVVDAVFKGVSKFWRVARNAIVHQPGPRSDP